MTSEVNKGHIRLSKFQKKKICIIIFIKKKTFYECQHHEDANFSMNYDLKGHPRSYKTSFMPISF